MASGESPTIFVANGGNAEVHSKNGATTSPLMRLPLVHPASHHVVGLPWCTQDIPRSLGVARVSPWVCVEAELEVAALTWGGGSLATKHGEAPATHKSPPRSRGASHWQPSALLTPTAWQTNP